MKIFKYVIAGILPTCMLGCQKYTNPLDEEQYEKSVYLVGANQSNDLGRHIVDLPYKESESDTAETFISVATGGSKNIDRDVTVTVEEAGSYALEQYNGLYLYKSTDIRYQYLGSAYYQIPSYSVTLSAGDVYGRIPIGINTAALPCDSLYGITFRIASVSDPDYLPIRSTDSLLIFSFNLYNDYSGTYQAEGYYQKYNSTDTSHTAISLSRTMKAVSYNQLRFYHLTTTETMDSVANKGVLLTVNTDNSVSVASWNNLVITDGGGTYDADKKTLTLWYIYTDSGVAYKFTGTYTKS
ncbi:MAG: DUF4361 domain-containing protein [Chitinophagaceae bacterium]